MSTTPTTFEQLHEAYLGWVEETFPHETGAEQFEHLRKEFKELCDDPSSEEEYADVLMLLLCVARNNGVDVVEAFRRKFAVNQRRTWARTADGFRHVKPEGDNL